MDYNEEDFLMLSGIQHFEFCRRQWALIHIEQQWAENLRTVEGEIMHKKAHDINFSESRKGVLTTRGMAVFSKVLGISGECDVVEFHLSKNGIEIFGRTGRYDVIPIEYKRGEPKENDTDAVQLTAQAICLDEMLCCDIKFGYLYYGETRHRYKIEFTEELKDKVRKNCKEMHQYFERQYTPKVKVTKKCSLCSLKNICVPRLCKNITVREYIRQKVEEDKN